nr:tail fiber domain-containing protein [Agrobacterium pusense]
MASDRRVKKDVKKVGRLMGHNLYEYQYKGERDDGRRHVGVMAQEVEKKRPDAVVDIGGTKHVRYGRLFEIGERMAA